MRPPHVFRLSLLASSALSQGLSPDQELKANFRLYSEYSEAAYCPSVTDGPAEHSVCENQDPGACLDLVNTTTTFKEFNSRKLLDFEKYGVSGYVARDPVKQTIIVAFRGTTTAKDVLTDLYFTMGDTKELCEDCQVHNGFRAAFSSVKTDVLKAVQTLKDKKGYTKVVVTGHSLGGAVATVASAYLRKRGHNCDLYTYGSPRVGNRQFARFVENQNQGTNFRIANQNDAVVAIPLAGLGRFRWFLRNRYDHIFPQYWYKDGFSKTGNPYDANFERHRVNQFSTCIKDKSLFGFSGPLDALTCSVEHHRVYANVDPNKKNFNPCGDKKARTEEEEDEELTAEEHEMLDKSLRDEFEDAAAKKACVNSCKSEEGESCQPVGIKRLEDAAKCRCTVRLTGQGEPKDEDRDEIECDKDRGSIAEPEA
ncbi:lipase (class 3) domain-containing protein [Hirsutella rhossiliensis]|uniref:Lipase (Class 3) domain-containing protein n=1 Tax=Hirsutella rhossiliensis TaxID=111463 RepID=A0A9P8SI38_9HYPO|nr:lipase (class 3) domain-containing protein [Hirsutella rhossiliensis]KAH0962794.1 lipase (class 3) domain-containing protein [Hirsutella rhossiliensis]